MTNALLKPSPQNASIQHPNVKELVKEAPAVEVEIRPQETAGSTQKS
jgi:hypothetical protein